MTDSIPFPHPALTPITDKPTAATIKQLKKETFANARSVHSELGGGMNGHLGIVMAVAPYVIRAGQPFVAPIHPGIQAANAAQAQITAANRFHDKAKDDYTTYNKVHENLKQQMLTAVKPIYYQDLKMTHSFTPMSPFQLYYSTSPPTMGSLPLRTSNITVRTSLNSGTPMNRSKTYGNVSAASAVLRPPEAAPSLMDPLSN
jgi:hypothetical protein